MDLAELKTTLGSDPQVPMTMAGAHLAKVTDRQLRALIVACRDGVVYRGGKPDQATVATLAALARKGHLVLTPKPGTKKYDWSYGKLTPAGLHELHRKLVREAR